MEVSQRPEQCLVQDRDPCWTVSDTSCPLTCRRSRYRASARSRHTASRSRHASPRSPRTTRSPSEAP
eukprot:789538-Rhodomonas_salina.2